MNSVVPELVVQAFNEHGLAALPAYATLLTDACEHVPPPFGQAWYGDRFRALASEPVWLLRTLALCSETEGQGAAILWKLAGRVTDPGIESEVRRHAVDESRHSRMFLALAETTFPGGLPGDLRRGLKRLAPQYRLGDLPPRSSLIEDVELLDTIIQMNFGEIRTRINQLLLRPVVTVYARPEARERLTRLLDALLRDETRHVAYTARLIERGVASRGTAVVRRLMRKRLAELNEITRDEVGAAVFD
jgi:hypothetical protein